MQMLVVSRSYQNYRIELRVICWRNLEVGESGLMVNLWQVALYSGTRTRHSLIVSLYYPATPKIGIKKLLMYLFLYGAESNDFDAGKSLTRAHGPRNGLT